MEGSVETVGRPKSRAGSGARSQRQGSVPFEGAPGGGGLRGAPHLLRGCQPELLRRLVCLNDARGRLLAQPLLHVTLAGLQRAVRVGGD